MSVFTYDPDPPRVASPWLQSDDPMKEGKGASGRSPTPADPLHSLLSEYGVKRLPPEPQEGPTEYKLHLLLRSRKSQPGAITPSDVSKSQRSKPSSFPDRAESRGVALASSTQSRQDRCQQLTTQLLWRLRQSSPYHASTSYQNIAVPPIPDDSAFLGPPPGLAKLAPGLEESRGALYEIGVKDDGSLVGITEDELEQSVATLRWMAASLGCNIEVLRRVVVGECVLDEDGYPVDEPNTAGETQKLWAAEVLVRPELSSAHKEKPGGVSTSDSAGIPGSGGRPTLSLSAANQLRITLTGPTTSGKSTLLGTLSTGILDDGHGKSRLNSLKHRHEVESGLTSTVTQDLIGYVDGSIINYAVPNVESWIGIHDHTRDGRLVLVSDSAGHPRYRRTTLRGLIGWSPHWTCLCIAATDAETPSGSLSAAPQDLQPTAANAHQLSQAHLDLCLKLELPLVVIITKYDLANKDVLRRTLTPIWTAIKNADRSPVLLPLKARSSGNLGRVLPEDSATITKLLGGVVESGNFLSTVPVVLTSAVSGEGIGLVHALLQNLPIPPPPTAQDFIGEALNPEQPATLYHIEERFSLPAANVSVSAEQGADTGTVVGGHLRFGSLSVNDKVVVGPFPPEEADDDGGGGLTEDYQPSPGNYGIWATHPSSAELSRVALHNAVSATTIKGEWHAARIVSIRNLRLSVPSLTAGQVGTVGLVFDARPEEGDEEEVEGPEGRAERPAAAAPKLRKGMVIAIPSRHMLNTRHQLQAASVVTAFFRDANITALAPSAHVIFYTGSVRAQARVLKVKAGKTYPYPSMSATRREEEHDDVFNVSERMEGTQEEEPLRGFTVKLELLYGREWIEMGSRIIILEGAGTYLDGFVGRVVKIED